MKIEIQCEVCGNKVLRERGEVSRNLRLGRRTCCSLKCSGKISNKHLRQYLTIGKIPESLVGFAGNRRDKFSPFRKWITSIKTRNKHSLAITIEDLKNQWDKQDGICPYSGKKMRLVRQWSPDQASLDRIDSSRGYTVDNIQFVCLLMQYAKNGFTHKQVKDFFA